MADTSNNPATAGNDAIPEPSLTPPDRTVSLMGAYDSIFASSYRFASYTPDLLTNQKGYDIYETMLTLSACRAPLNVKRYAVLSKGITVTPAVQDPAQADYAQAQELADALKWALDNIEDDAGNWQDMRSVVWELLRGAWEGFRVSEIEWRVVENRAGGNAAAGMTTKAMAGKLGFSMFASKPCKQIGFDLDPRTLAVRSLIPYTPMTGYGPPVPVEKVLLYTANPENSLPYGAGDGRACYKHWWCIDTLVKLWGFALERWGGPNIIGKYPAGDAKAMAAGQAAMDSIRAGAAALFPDNMTFDLVQLQPGVLDSFQSAVEWHKAECANNILGATLTTGAQTGSGTNTNALGQVHQDTQSYALDHLAADIEGVLNAQLVRRFVRYNFGERAMALCPKISLGQRDQEDLAQLTTMFTSLVTMGNMHKQAKVIRQRLGIPPMDKEEEKQIQDEDAQKQALEQAKIKSHPALNPSSAA